MMILAIVIFIALLINQAVFLFYLIKRDHAIRLHSDNYNAELIKMVVNLNSLFDLHVKVKEIERDYSINRAKWLAIKIKLNDTNDDGIV